MLSVCKVGGSGSEELKKCPPPFPAAMWFVNVHKRKPRWKKKKKNILLLWFIGIRLKKYSDYLIGFRLVLWYIGPGSEKDINWINCQTDSNITKFRNFNFPRSDYVSCLKNQMLMLFVANFVYFLYPTRAT